MRKKKNTLTITQVAQEAGVSVQTVSRVMNNYEYVADGTRQHVQEVIKRLGYRPSGIARSLASRRSYTLGLVTSDLSDPFFALVAAGAEVEASRNNYFCILSSTERNLDDEARYVRMLTERFVEGIFLARPSTIYDDDHLAELIANGLPVVTTAYHLPASNLMVVDVDNVEGGYQAVAHLTRLGHRDIAMITGPMAYKSARDRLEGYCKALAEHSILYEEARVVVTDGWHYEDGYNAMNRLLLQPVSFTALFAQSDEMAIGAIRALKEAGKHVPADVSVIGYNDLDVSTYYDPPLTTIFQPKREIGVLGVQLLIQAIEHPGSVKGEFLLKTHLVERESCRRLE
jgi:LacI family transcriptional regulator